MTSSTARRRAVWATGLMLTLGSFAVTVVEAQGSPAAVRVSPATVPAGFTDTVIGGFRKPVALAATPDGRILALQQGGVVRVIQDNALLPTPALDISLQVCAAKSERGLLGVAVDPNFGVNGYVYLYYTYKKFGVCPRDTIDVPVNRVSRFTMTGNTIDPSSEKILVDEIINYNGNHNAGNLGFGKDGLLYASVGDGGCDYEAPHGCDKSNGIAQRLNSLQGKVLRIRPNGGIPSTNPFTGPGSARCNHGAIAAGMQCQEIYLYGLRNPFRFAFDPNAAKTRLFVNDVGQATWEEIDNAVKGANYGWNVREGPCAVGSETDCGPPPAGMTNPIFAYTHSATGCQAITGGAFVPAGVWGAAYASGYFYADFVCGEINLLRPDGSGGWTSTPFATLAAAGPVALMFGPHNGATSLYYTTLVNGGEIHVVDQQ